MKTVLIDLNLNFWRFDMKPGANFKINRSVKRRMATIVNPFERHSYKNAMIHAQLVGNKPVVHEKKQKTKNGE
jgi:hypothetical protein